MDGYRFAGYRIIEFPAESRVALKEVAEKLIPDKQKILDLWIEKQWKAWQPPGLTKDTLKNNFGRILDKILDCMANGELEKGMLDLEQIGTELAEIQFPFQALIISIHFMEESYLSILLNPHSPRTHVWLIAMDEFLHGVLAAVATSYFESYRKELLDQVEVGRIVQEGLLAEIPKNTEDLEIAHIYISARERAKLGGDFLDFFTLQSNVAAFIIGDLAGHGLDAAADSIMLRSLYRGFMREELNAISALERMNNVLINDLKSGLFATALAITYEKTGIINLVSAGHPYPIICEDNKARLLKVNGSALAIVKDTKYECTQTKLHPGGVIAAYTDGLIEARNDNSFFGEERVMKVVEKVSDASARGIAEQIIDEALRFAGGKFSDDVAILVIKRCKNC